MIKVVYLVIQEASRKWRACPTKCFGYDASMELEIRIESFYDWIWRPFKRLRL